MDMFTDWNMTLIDTIYIERVNVAIGRNEKRKVRSEKQKARSEKREAKSKK